MKSFLIIFIALFSTLLSCRKPTSQNCNNGIYSLLENENFEQTSKAKDYTNSIFILNEGGFTYGNASVSAYNPNTNEIVNNVFSTVNNLALGDIAQSIVRKGELLYITVNNSQKIEVVNRETFERKKTIAGLSSPRYLLFQEDEKAMITDLYERKINVIDLEAACEIGSIETKAWTEEIFETQNGIWAIERNGIGEAKFANLIQIDATNLSVLSRFNIPIEPNSIIVDEASNFWILSSGLESDNEFPQLIKFNTATKSIENSFSFPDFNKIAQNLAYSNNTLFFNKGNDIFEMQTNASSLPSSMNFTTNTQNIYNISIHPLTNEFYICDAVDYVSNGKLLRYDSGGNLLNEVTVGVIPSKVLF